RPAESTRWEKNDGILLAARQNPLQCPGNAGALNVIPANGDPPRPGLCPQRKGGRGLGEGGGEKKRGLHRLVDRLSAAEPQAAIKPNGRIVLSRHFQEGPSQPGAAEPVQGLHHEGLPQAASPVQRHDPKVLDRSQAGSLPNPLYRATI